ncbi:MAG TPA: DAK2 domain-containing protein [Candidatus Limnocylindria bacterium]|nr:DAK2 domain-containing protein [Candidatus Limnocylindria bacterium]
MPEVRQIDAHLLREMVTAGAAVLERNREAVNALNVFPVPDGDTGTNMSMTMMSAVREMGAKEPTTLGAMAEALSRGALRGARGNSGVILSQLFRGFSKAVADAQTIDPTQFAQALRAGAETAYKAVMKPKEGTILTVARVIADDAVRQAEQEPDSFSELLRVMLTSGEGILKRTQEMLPALTQAGVVDAGGRGLLLIYMGYAAIIDGDKVEDLMVDMSGDSAEGEGFVDDHDLIGEIHFAYCTEFFIQQLKPGTGEADVAMLRRKLSRIGDCALVVGDTQLIKVHVHTNDPGKALQIGMMLGELSGMKIENMLQQRRELDNKPETPEKDYGIVAVSQGSGFSAIFKDLGVDSIVEGGQTMNPSIENLQKAVDGIRAKTIFILPNNGNITLAARQVAEMAKNRVIVLPTKNVAMGIAAVIAFQPEETPEENELRMTEAAERVRTGMVTYAVRSSDIKGLHIERGDVVGMNNGEITATSATPEDCARELMRQIITDDDGLITVYFGEKTREEDARRLGEELAQTYSHCDVEVHLGGQQLYFYLLSVE